jgi:enoyl-CoA hydratase/carnithine racemase
MGLLTTSFDAGILVLGLNRPERLNALSPALVEELGDALDRAERPDVRVVVLRGEGRSFCAGADVHEALGIEDLDAAAAFLTSLAAVLHRISTLPAPVVAAVQGHAVGGGAELALEADLRVVAEDAVLSFPDVALGSTPASLHRLVRLVGRGRAAAIAMLGEDLGAAEMLRAGVAQRVTPASELDAAALELATTLRDRASGRSLRFAKEALNLAEDPSRTVELRANVAAMLACYASKEQRAFVAGFGGRSGDAGG